MYLDERGTPSICQSRRRRTIRARAALDVALLQRQVLEDMLRIGDIRTDKRIDFVGGASGAAALEQAVNSGQGRGRVLDVPGDRSTIS